MLSQYERDDNMMEKTREGLTTVITDRCLLYLISGRASLVLMSKTQIAALREFSRMAVAEETKTKFFLSEVFIVMRCNA